MDVQELNLESLECARYGEPEELRQLLVDGADSCFQDEYGNTALHKAAANGELECMKILKEFGTKYVPNLQGNYPLHWAAQNGKTDAVKFLLDNYEVDVCIQNSFGRSIITEAFQSQNSDVIELCLSHSSASEDKLVPNATNNNNNTSTNDSSTTDKLENDNDINTSNNNNNNIYHFMQFNTIDTTTTTTTTPPPTTTTIATTTTPPIIAIRECPISRADNPFGSDSAPEDDTTGLGIWPASIITCQWVLQNKALLQNKVVVELGAGCGLPGLVSAYYCDPKEVYITDIHHPTLENTVYNVHLNQQLLHSHSSSCSTSTHINNDNSDNNNCNNDNNNTNNSNTVDNDINKIETSISIPRSPSTTTATTTATTTTTTNTNIDSNRIQLYVKKVIWGDSSTYPLQQTENIDIIIGSDLVYEDRILDLLISTVQSMLKLGGHFLYVAPPEGRRGMNELVDRLSAAGFECIHQAPAPVEYYKNPLVRHSVIGSLPPNTTTCTSTITSATNTNNSKPVNEIEDSMKNKNEQKTAENQENDPDLVDQHSGQQQVVKDDKEEEEKEEEEREDTTDDVILYFYDLSIQKPYICYHFIKKKLI